MACQKDAAGAALKKVAPGLGSGSTLKVAAPGVSGSATLFTTQVAINQVSAFKGIVSRDFEGLEMILMDRTCVPDVPLEVYSFLYFHLDRFFDFLVYIGLSLYYCTSQKLSVRPGTIRFPGVYY